MSLELVSNKEYLTDLADLTDQSDGITAIITDKYLYCTSPT